MTIRSWHVGQIQLVIIFTWSCKEYTSDPCQATELFTYFIIVFISVNISNWNPHKLRPDVSGNHVLSYSGQGSGEFLPTRRCIALEPFREHSQSLALDVSDVGVGGYQSKSGARQSQLEAEVEPLSRGGVIADLFRRAKVPAEQIR